MVLQEDGDFASGDRDGAADGQDRKQEAEKESVREEMPEPKKVVLTSVA